MIMCCYRIQILVTVNLVLCCQNNFYCWKPLSKYLVKVSNRDTRVKFRVDSKDKVSLLLTLYMFAFYTSLTPPTFPENIRKHVATCFGVSSVGFKRQYRKMVKHTQTICCQFIGNWFIRISYVVWVQWLHCSFLILFYILLKIGYLE